MLDSRERDIQFVAERESRLCLVLVNKYILDFPLGKRKKYGNFLFCSGPSPPHPGSMEISIVFFVSQIDTLLIPFISE